MEENKKINEFLVNTNGNETMLVSNLKNKSVNYVLIKIGNKWLSTEFGKKANIKATLSDTNTKNIGKEKSLRVTGFLVETNGHKKLENPEQFEVTLYFED